MIALHITNIAVASSKSGRFIGGAGYPLLHELRVASLAVLFRVATIEPWSWRLAPPRQLNHDMCQSKRLNTSMIAAAVEDSEP